MLRPKKGPNGKFGYVNSKDESWAIQPMYEEVTPFCKDHVAVATISKERSILINQKNENVTGKIYSKVDTPVNGYRIVHEVDLEGVVDMHGNEVTKSEVVCIIDITSYGTAPMMKGDKYGVVNLTTRKKIECIYDSIIDFFDNRDTAIANLNGKYGMINWDNETIIPFEYDLLSAHPKHGIIVARIGTKEGILDFEGNVLYPIEYDDIIVIGDTVQLKKVHITTLTTKS